MINQELSYVLNIDKCCIEVNLKMKVYISKEYAYNENPLSKSTTKMNKEKWQYWPNSCKQRGLFFI